MKNTAPTSPLVRGVVLALAVLAWAAIMLLWWGLFSLPTDQAGGLTGAEGLVVTHLNVPAEASQFRPGDILVRVRGYSLGEWLSPNLARSLAVLRDSHPGQIATYTVRRGDELMTLSLPLVRVNPLDGLQNVALMLPIALAFLAMATFIAWRRPLDPAARMIFVCFLVVVLNIVDDSVNETNTTWLLAFYPFIQLVEIVTFWLVASTALHFSLIFPRPHPWVQRFPWLVWVIHLINPLLSTAVGLASGSAPLWDLLTGAGETTRYVVGILLWVWAVANLTRSFRAARTPIERAQLRWLAWGMAVSVVPWVAGFTAPLIIGGVRLGIIQTAVLWLLMSIMPLAFAFAILRYRLMDIDTVINRSLVYAALSAVLVGVYLLLATGLSRLFLALSGNPNNTTVVFLSTLGAVLAFAPARTRIQAAIDRLFYRQRLNLPALLAEWSKTLAMTLDLQHLTELMVDSVPARLGLENAAMWTWHEPTGRFITPRGEVLAEGQAAQRLSKTMLAADTPVFVNPPDTPADPVLAPLRAQPLEIAVPLIVSSRLVGLYAVGAKRSGAWYNRAEVEFLETMGHQAAIALENSRSYQTIARQVSELSTLHILGQAISAELDLDALIDLVLSQVTITLNFDRALMMVVDDERQALTGARAVGGTPAQLEKLTSLEIPLNEQGGLFAEVLLSGRSVLIDDASREASGELGWLVGELQTRAFIMAPLRVQDQPVGILAADRLHSNASIQPDEVRLLDTLASQVAVAVHNARLVKQLAEQERLKRELEIARTIQTSLLPTQIPDWPGLEVYGTSLPAREVGGDFYSFLTLTGGATAIAVGDVSGKGVPGALFMAVALGVMRAQAPAFHNAAQFLQALNATLYEQMMSTHMNVALVYAILKPAHADTWTLRASNGGLIAPLLLAHDGQCDYLDTCGLPLGATPYAAYNEIDIRLARGDVLVLCSDGIVEAMDAERELFSFGRLQQALVGLRDRPAVEIASSLLEAARQFAGSAEFDDDATIVVVRVT